MRPAILRQACSRRRQLDGCNANFAFATRKSFATSIARLEDPRLKDFGRVIEDDYSAIRDKYAAPKNPIILAHGLLGFDELRLGGGMFPGIHYWRGIIDALAQKGVEVMTATVPPAASIEARAARLAEAIREKANGKSVNIIAGLDSRYMISKLHLADLKVLSLTTIATPHHGSAFADYMFEQIGPWRVKRLYKMMDKLGLETGAFAQLTRKYMAEEFNPQVPDVDSVRYFSYGASLYPQRWSVFRVSHDIIKRIEHAENDGLVSVPSSQWGTYKGTLMGVSHLDLINWTNRFKWYLWQLAGTKKNFNAVAFYLDITDMLAKEGL